MSSPSPSYPSSLVRSPITPSPLSIPASQQFRLRAREGHLVPYSVNHNTPLTAITTCGTTSNIQANLLVLPSRYAEDFKTFCARNPVPCPLLDITSPGEYRTRLAAYTDLRTDIPAYNIFVDGVLKETGKGDTRDEWSQDHIGFLIGCSYSFEAALAKQGLAPRHMILRQTVPMFISNIPLNPSGAFSKGTYVVSMRWYKPEDISLVQEITRKYARQHGEPIAWGWEGAEKLGVLAKIHLEAVDFGEWTNGQKGEVPVFWASGVTAQYAVMLNKIEGVTLSNTPGCMFVTDIPDEEALMRISPGHIFYFH